MHHHDFVALFQFIVDDVLEFLEGGQPGRPHPHDEVLIIHPRQLVAVEFLCGEFVRVEIGNFLELGVNVGLPCDLARTFNR